jgi:ADP-heptose:LPS heptosyltransferase
MPLCLHAIRADRITIFPGLNDIAQIPEGSPLMIQKVKTLFCASVCAALYGSPRNPTRSLQSFLKDIKKILVVRDDHIGDLICSLPVFEALKKALPNAHITLVASTYNAQIAEGNSFIDEILHYPKHKHSAHGRRYVSTWQQYRFLKSLRAKSFDLAIGLRSHFSHRQGQIVYASGAPYRLGHFPQRKRYRHLSFFYNIPALNPRSYKHEVERSLDVVRSIGIDLTDPLPEVKIDETSRRFAESQAERLGIAGHPVIGYHISNRDSVNCWSIDNFLKLIHLFKKNYKNSSHIITYAPNDHIKAFELATSGGEDCHAIGTNTIREVGALQQKCDLFITVDGAPNHLSAALGIPTLTLFGGSDPTVWGPWGPKNWSIKKSDDINKIKPEDLLEKAARIINTHKAY